MVNTYKMWAMALMLQGCTMALAQNKDEPPKATKLTELKLKLNEDGSQYIKATFLNQVWIRYTQNNPGTTLDGYLENGTFDIGLRRTRIQLFCQLSEKVFFYTQIGQNNLSYHSVRKQGLFLHDAVGELSIIENHLSIGAGLTGWSGLSRYASPSVGSILTMDAPIYQQATSDVSDQFLRKFSLYTKGKLGGFDYRLAVSKPMTIATSAVQDTKISEKSLFSPLPPHLQYQGYVMYQFLDKESNLTPYNVGCYLGKKNVLNLGAGFIYQKEAMWHSEHQGADTLWSNLVLLAIDVFYDHPLNTATGTAITAYASLSSNDYGNDYVRNVGVMNPANGIGTKSSFNGGGNAFPMMGTGVAAYGQLGYLLKRDLLGKMGTLQPYVASEYAQYPLLDDPMLMYELGFNWLVSAHQTKISTNYQSRPVFENTASNQWVVSERKGMWVIQLQVLL